MARTDEEILAGYRSKQRSKDESKAKFSQLLPYLLQHKKVLSVVLVLGILGAVTSLAQPVLIAQVIAAVEQSQPLGGLIWLIAAVVVMGALLSSFEHYLLQRTGESVVLSSRMNLIGRMLRLPISQFDTRRTGDLVSRVSSDTTMLRAVLTQGLVEAVGGAITFVGAIVAMLLIDAVLLGLTVLVVVVAIVSVVVLSLKIRETSWLAQERVGDLAASVERSVSNIRTVRAANATEREVAEIAEDAKGAWRAGKKVAKISAMIMPISGIAMQLSFLVVLGVGGYRVASGAMNVAGLVSFIMFLFMMIMPLGQAFGAFTSVNQALGALGRIQEILAEPLEGQNDAIQGSDVSTEDADYSIQFDQVWFGYPDRAYRTEREKAVAEAIAGLTDEDTDWIADQHENSLSQGAADQNSLAARAADDTARAADDTARAADDTARAADDTAPTSEKSQVLRGVSFTIPNGKRTALVGPSGAGKSTILALIERFYDPSDGEIRLGHRRLSSLQRHWLRAQLGYVQQDAPVLAGSIRSNLLLASPGASDEDCLNVLAEVNLSEVLDRDPRGLDAPVGEKGVMLSGGERQRLAIARTLLGNAPILLLDESTSNLDGLNEQRLTDAIDRAAKSRTVVIIAHRLSTVVDADQIIVLDEGKVIGIGTHEQLMQTTPLYQDLAKHQLLS